MSADSYTATADHDDRRGGADPTRSVENRHNGWLLGAGSLMVLLGIVAVVASFAATLTTVLLFGILLVAAGIAQIAHAVGSSTEDRGFDLFSGLFYAAAGALLVIDPVGGAIGLTLLVGMLFLLVGAVRLSTGLRRRRRSRGGGVQLTVGVLDLLLGAMVLLSWPGSSTWFIGLFVGIELVLGGFALMTAAADRPEQLRARSA